MRKDAYQIKEYIMSIWYKQLVTYTVNAMVIIGNTNVMSECTTYANALLMNIYVNYNKTYL